MKKSEGWSASENCFLSAQLPQANFKMGGIRNSEAGRLNCYKFSKSQKNIGKCVVYQKRMCYSIFTSKMINNSGNLIFLI